MGYYDYNGWTPYVTVAERKRRAEKQRAKMLKAGVKVAPVSCEGRTVARTFWGKAWCQNLERYSDYANRLPRGRSYLKNGLVVDLQVKAGEVAAVVSGTSLYSVKVKINPVAKKTWEEICKDCAGGIDSLVELLQGKFSDAVMERICRKETGLFPSPKEIKLICSCPDWATMCKHVAAVLYGIGARLDEKPELLFVLREVRGDDLIAKAGKGLPLSKRAPEPGRVLEDAALSEMFGIDLEMASADELPASYEPAPERPRAKRKPPAGRKPVLSKPVEVKRPAKKSQSGTPKQAVKQKTARVSKTGEKAASKRPTLQTSKPARGKAKPAVSKKPKGPVKAAAKVAVKIPKKAAKLSANRASKPMKNATRSAVKKSGISAK